MQDAVHVIEYVFLGDAGYLRVRLLEHLQSSVGDRVVPDVLFAFAALVEHQRALVIAEECVVCDGNIAGLGLLIPVQGEALAVVHHLKIRHIMGDECAAFADDDLKVLRSTVWEQLWL